MALAPMPTREQSAREEHFSEEARAFLAWLRSMMEDRRTTQRQLSLYTGIPLSTISTWFSLGRIPKLEQLVRVARHFGVALADIPGAPRIDEPPPADIPPYLTDLLAELDPHEQRVVAETARSLLELREARAEYGATPEPPTPPPASSPPATSPPSRRRSP